MHHLPPHPRAANLQDERHIAVHDVLGETREMLEFRDPVVKMALGEARGSAGHVDVPFKTCVPLLEAGCRFSEP